MIKDSLLIEILFKTIFAEYVPIEDNEVHVEEVKTSHY